MGDVVSQKRSFKVKFLFSKGHKIKQILTNTLELSPVYSLEREQHLRTQRHSETVFRSCNFFSNIRRVIHSLVPRLPVPSQEK